MSEDREQINNDLELWLSYSSSCKTAGFFGNIFVHSVKIREVQGTITKILLDQKSQFKRVYIKAQFKE